MGWKNRMAVATESLPSVPNGEQTQREAADAAQNTTSTEVIGMLEGDFLSMIDECEGGN